MPVLLIWLGTAFRTFFVWLVAQAARWVPTIAGNVMLGLGIKFLVLDPGLGNLTSQLVSRFNIVSGSVLETIYYLNVDDFCTLILSALAARQIGRVVLARRTA